MNNQDTSLIKWNDFSKSVEPYTYAVCTVHAVHVMLQKLLFMFCLFRIIENNKQSLGRQNVTNLSECIFVRMKLII